MPPKDQPPAVAERPAAAKEIVHANNGPKRFLVTPFGVGSDKLAPQTVAGCFDEADAKGAFYSYYGQGESPAPVPVKVEPA